MPRWMMTMTDEWLVTGLDGNLQRRQATVRAPDFAEAAAEAIAHAGRNWGVGGQILSVVNQEET